MRIMWQYDMTIFIWILLTCFKKASLLYLALQCALPQMFTPEQIICFTKTGQIIIFQATSDDNPSQDRLKTVQI